jgi:hypothetical protein
MNTTNEFVPPGAEAIPFDLNFASRRRGRKEGTKVGSVPKKFDSWQKTK